MALPAILRAQIYEFRYASGLYRVEYIPNEKLDKLAAQKTSYKDHI